jgi:endonuclease/exonuclease/phosphatase family metal-dependent hydrolase
LICLAVFVALSLVVVVPALWSRVTGSGTPPGTTAPTANKTPTAPPATPTQPVPPTISINPQVRQPSRILAVSAKPGPGVGEVTVSWRQDGVNTTGFWLETGLSSFSPTIATMAQHGRNAHWFAVAAAKRSVTLTAAQVAAAGAPAGSGNHLDFRLSALNRTAAGDRVRNWPHLQTVAVRPPTPSTTGVPLRVATFNVRTAHATQDIRGWLQRAPHVAAEILAHRLGVVALQELGPYAADGTPGSYPTDLRQTSSLLDALAAAGGSQYKLVRTTPYMPPHTAQGTQGARILFDSSRYALLSSCPDSVAEADYSASCTIDMPVLSGDAGNNLRKAGYAEFADRATGKRFFVVSVHLDPRKGDTPEQQRSFDQLRASQVQAVLQRMDATNPDRIPVVFAGDLNTWQNDRAGYSAHDALVAAGYFDTAAATTQVNVRYSTINDFATTMPEPLSGYGARIDAILVKGVTGASYFENVMKKVDGFRPSDHNLVLADIRLP